MKKRGIYIGNRLRKGHYLSIVDHIGGRLNDTYEMKLASAVPNKILRMLDMVIYVLRYGFKAHFLIIDVYSTINFYYALIISQLCRLIQLPYITNLHGGNLPHRLTSSRYLCNLIFKNAAVNIAPSAYLQDAFIEKGYATERIPNSVDLDSYTYKKREVFTPRILYVRAIKDLYNPKMAIEVLYILKAQYPNVHLTMYGPHLDNSIHDLNNLIKSYHLEDNISLPGAVEKQKWMSESIHYDIFINTSNIDNTPFSILEAMALGLPVISTNVGGIPKLIRQHKNGIMVNKNDFKEMAHYIIYLIENPDKACELTDNARKDLEEYDWNKNVKSRWIQTIDKFAKQ